MLNAERWSYNFYLGVTRPGVDSGSTGIHRRRRGALHAGEYKSLIQESSGAVQQPRSKFRINRNVEKVNAKCIKILWLLDMLKGKDAVIIYPCDINKSVNYVRCSIQQEKLSKGSLIRRLGLFYCRDSRVSPLYMYVDKGRGKL